MVHGSRLSGQRRRAILPGHHVSAAGGQGQQTILSGRARRRGETHDRGGDRKGPSLGGRVETEASIQGGRELQTVAGGRRAARVAGPFALAAAGRGGGEPPHKGTTQDTEGRAVVERRAVRLASLHSGSSLSF